jgi:hypothetical protein
MATNDDSAASLVDASKIHEQVAERTKRKRDAEETKRANKRAKREGAQAIDTQTRAVSQGSSRQKAKKSGVIENGDGTIDLSAFVDKDGKLTDGNNDRIINQKKRRMTGSVYEDKISKDGNTLTRSTVKAGFTKILEFERRDDGLFHRARETTVTDFYDRVVEYAKDGTRTVTEDWKDSRDTLQFKKDKNGKLLSLKERSGYSQRILSEADANGVQIETKKYGGLYTRSYKVRDGERIGKVESKTLFRKTKTEEKANGDVVTTKRKGFGRSQTVIRHADGQVTTITNSLRHGRTVETDRSNATAPIGATGPTVAAGATGPTVAAGVTGPTVAAGATGPTVAAGVTGPAMQAGATGLAPAGVSAQARAPFGQQHVGSEADLNAILDEAFNGEAGQQAHAGKTVPAKPAKSGVAALDSLFDAELRKAAQPAARPGPPVPPAGKGPEDLDAVLDAAMTSSDSTARSAPTAPAAGKSGVASLDSLFDAELKKTSPSAARGEPPVPPAGKDGVEDLNAILDGVMDTSHSTPGSAPAAPAVGKKSASPLWPLFDEEIRRTGPSTEKTEPVAAPAGDGMDDFDAFLNASMDQSSTSRPAVPGGKVSRASSTRSTSSVSTAVFSEDGTESTASTVSRRSSVHGDDLYGLGDGKPARLYEPKGIDAYSR